MTCRNIGARRRSQAFFPRYSGEHRHSRPGLHAPADVHYGTAETGRVKPVRVVDAAATTNAIDSHGPTEDPTPTESHRTDDPGHSAAHVPRDE